MVTSSLDAKHGVAGPNPRNPTPSLQPLQTLHTMPDSLTGGCLCGSIRFRASKAPLRTLVCHCTFCQRMTGSSAYAESLFQVEDVTFSGEGIRRYTHRSDSSGKNVFVEFCSNCGTTLGLTFERWPDIRAISRGCYDDPNAVEVTANIWTRSAQSGVALPAGIDCFLEARMTLDGQANVPQRFDSPIMSVGDRDD